MWPTAITLLLFPSLLFLVTSEELDCSKVACEAAQKVYTEIGCLPMIEDGECCPSRYNCSHVQHLNTSQCHFNNQTYSFGKMVADEETSHMCHAACQCTSASADGGAPYFNCASIECPEFFSPPDPDCSWQTEKHRCCGLNKVCGEERAKLHHCYLDGLTYVEHQWMYPDNAGCKKCWCTEGWDNSTIDDNPLCQEIECGIELTSLWRIQAGCAAVYYRDRQCCPIGWRCPNAQDEVIRHGKAAEQLEETANLCRFGHLRLNIGDELASPEEMKCKCTQPPFLDCIQTV